MAALFIAVVLLGIGIVVGYSILVAVREPDMQETVVLGQGTLESGNPAGLRVLVRDRKSGRPIEGATDLAPKRSAATGTGSGARGGGERLDSS